MAGCLISAKLWLLGLDAQGRPMWRHDATIRVDDGMVAQIGAFEAVAYGVDLPHYGDARGVALPFFAPPSGLAARFGGMAGRLTPGSPAHVALFPADGPPPSREALSSAGAQVFLDGRPAEGNALRGLLDGPETPAESAVWAAAKR